MAVFLELVGSLDGLLGVRLGKDDQLTELDVGGKSGRVLCGILYRYWVACCEIRRSRDNFLEFAILDRGLEGLG